MRLIIAGIGTDVGKTCAAAVIVQALAADYWKPFDYQMGDTETVRSYISTPQTVFHPPAYCFKHPVSPHEAAAREGLQIQPITPPQSERPLVIESSGGVLVPLSYQCLTIDLFAEWQAQWIVVSRTLLGSINHTLLTLEALERRNCPLSGIIFNGAPNPYSEEAILAYSRAPLLGRLLPEKTFSKTLIKRYAKAWQPALLQL